MIEALLRLFAKLDSIRRRRKERFLFTGEISEIYNCLETACVLHARVCVAKRKERKRT